MATTSLRCPICAKYFEKENKEINRRRNEMGLSVLFYCSISCGAVAANAPRKIERQFFVKNCRCGRMFETTEENVCNCSRRCASLFSFNENRKQALNSATSNGVSTRFTRENSLERSSDGLRKREWYKYSAIHNFLMSFYIPHCFEFLVPNSRYIYDLVLFDSSLLIEFDEIHHVKRKETDDLKDNTALANGWNICRLDVNGIASPFPPSLITPLVNITQECFRI